MDAYLRAGLRHVDIVTVQTHSMKRRFCARWGFPASRVAVVPSAIDPALLDVEAEKAREMGPAYVCYVAGPGPHKNHVVLAEVMASLATTHPNVICKLTVTRQAVPALVAAAERLKTIGAFEFLGAQPVSELRALVRRAAAVVVPSKLESFGLTYYEAMALGAPVVAADRDFAREACGDAALYADSDSGEDFAGALRTILESERVAADRVRRSRQRFADVAVTWDHIGRLYMDLLVRR
jgi:glycosyltransferase involved in cell wall biosynthesis